METQQKKPIVIVIEALISAGKSTLINEVLFPLLTEKGYKVKIIKEPVDEWMDILPLFYKNPSRYGYHFQTRAFHSRIVEAQKVYQQDDTDIYISERSILSDTLFMQTLYQRKVVTEMEYRDYLSLWKMWEQLLPFKPDLVVYLNPDINIIMERLKIRSREGEEDIKIDYQLDLKKNHDLLFNSNYVNSNLINYKLPVLKLDINNDFKSDINIQHDITNLIEKEVIKIY